jgi:hypothetical protein
MRILSDAAYEKALKDAVEAYKSSRQNYKDIDMRRELCTTLLILERPEFNVLTIERIKLDTESESTEIMYTRDFFHDDESENEPPVMTTWNFRMSRKEHNELVEKFKKLEPKIKADKVEPL